MRAGHRVSASLSLAEIRTRAASELARLPGPLRELDEGPVYDVRVSQALRHLATMVDQSVV